MLNQDAKNLARLEPVVKRVMVVDSNLASARLLADLMKGMGMRDVVFETDERHALEVARDFEPTLIFIERSGPRFDGENLARRIRRSQLACRTVPIIMVTSDATATNIKGARDAGVHEFMVKPFTTGDLVRRVVNVATKPRPWVEAVMYVGPDRRRFNSGEYKGPRKRSEENRAAAGSPASEGMEQARKIIVAALDQFNTDPTQARRALAAQGDALKSIAVQTGQTRLAVVSAELASKGRSGASVDDLRTASSSVLAILTQVMHAQQAA